MKVRDFLPKYTNSGGDWFTVSGWGVNPTYMCPLFYSDIAIMGGLPAN